MFRRGSEVYVDLRHLVYDDLPRREMSDAGFEMVDIPYDKVPAFMAERTKDYMATSGVAGSSNIFTGGTLGTMRSGNNTKACRPLRRHSATASR